MPSRPLVGPRHSLLHKGYSAQQGPPSDFLALINARRPEARNGTDPETALRSLARGLTNKLLHQPSVQVRKAMAEGRTEVTECLRELYQLDALEADEPTTTEKL